MTKPTYASSEHQIIVATYIVMIKEFVKDVIMKLFTDTGD